MPPELAVPPGYTAARFRAMDCDVRVLLPHPHRTQAFAVAHLFADWERRLSRFSPESELSRLNAAAGRPVQVSRLLAGVLRRALAAAEATGGLFDPTLGRRIADLGYAETFAHAGRGDTALAHVPPHAAKTRWRDVSIDPAGAVTVPAGVAIDLGGIAKGMAVDRSLALLRALGVPSALVSAGGDLAVTGSLPEGRAWPVAVEEPGTEAAILLRRGAIATSSTERRRWRAHGREQHHLLDPRTGDPAVTGVLRATVAAPTCEQAEVAAKSALILGVERGAPFLEERRLCGLLCTGRGATAAGGWPGRAQPGWP
jgi:thiamine biosynthesis lipoprotein